LAAVIAEHVWAAVPALVLVEGFQHPSGPVIMVGPQKSGTASEVLATVPAVNGMNGERLASELQRVLDAVLCRMRAPHATERTERPRD
jgi:molybdopterin-guanine dinucleotide biosynthesis protein